MQWTFPTWKVRHPALRTGILVPRLAWAGPSPTLASLLGNPLLFNWNTCLPGPMPSAFHTLSYEAVTWP